MKWLLRIGLIVVLLVVIAGVAAFIMIDSIATAAVQKGAAFATETDVEVEKVDVQLFGSSAEIITLEISNPQGDYLKAVETVVGEMPEDKQAEYREAFESFLVLGSGSAEVSAGSVMSDLIEIPKVELSDIEISLIGQDGKKNYEIILESLKRFQGDAPPEETKSEKQVVIKELIIRNITVYYYFDEDPALGAVAVGPKKIVLADDEPMVLTDVGSGGVPMSQITADIITDVMVQVTANLAGDLGGHVKGLANSLIGTIGDVKFGETLGELGLGDSIESLGDLGIDLSGGVLEGVGNLGDGVGEAIGGASDKIKEGLGGIIGGDGDKDKEGEKDKEKEGGGVLEGLNPF
ncbi:MAG: hypothetical protein AAF085_05865 [Planctomycetota bacterium]